MIISEKQQEANRKNAQHSTGPATPAAKEAIRFNALTFGLRTRASILPDENAAEYSQLWDEMEADWQPQTRTERLYLETMVTSQWLLKRVAESEQKIYVFIPHRHRGYETVAKRAAGPVPAAAHPNPSRKIRARASCEAGRVTRSATSLCDVGSNPGPFGLLRSGRPRYPLAICPPDL
jgi:hypothetical protein